jgi:hypothetical protein
METKTAPVKASQIQVSPYRAAAIDKGMSMRICRNNTEVLFNSKRLPP